MLTRMSNLELLTSAEARDRLGMSRTAFSRRVLAGEIPAAGRLPGRTGAWLFSPDVIDQLAREGVNQ